VRERDTWGLDKRQEAKVKDGLYTQTARLGKRNKEKILARRLFENPRDD
jgi:hypothetical protein